MDKRLGRIYCLRLQGKRVLNTRRYIQEYRAVTLVRTSGIGHTQRNGAVSKVDGELISHPTPAQYTLSAAELVKFLMRYQQFASHAYCRAARPVSKMASQQEKTYCVLRFEVSRSVITDHFALCSIFP
jgi:hypothetical protein